MKKPITDLDKYRYNFVKQTLRRTSFRWPPAGQARIAGRTERRINPKTGKLCWHARCSQCKLEFLEKEMQLDHIEPVVPTEQFILPEVWGTIQVPWTTCISLGSLVLRMFPEVIGYQLLCRPCHEFKSAGEAGKRAETGKLGRDFKDAAGNRKRSPGPKGRRGKVDVGTAAMEGCTRYDKGSNVRGSKVFPQWLAYCSKCEGTLSGSSATTPLCPKCGGNLRR